MPRTVRPNSTRRRSAALAALIATAGALSVLPAPASASQVMFENGLANYKASGGEDNKVVAWMSSSSTVKFTDTGAVIWNAGPGCTIIDDHNAECTKPALPGVRIGTGSAEDEISADFGSHKLRVLIESGSQSDTIDVTGTGYSATINAGASSGDTISEGDGRSTIYADGTTSNVNGGADIVNAGAQRDVIFGGKGNDQISGGPGADEIRGQQGNDTIYALDGTADAVLGCGPDVDTITLDPQDPLNLDCENVL